MDLMLKYPTILPSNSQRTEFKGFLPVDGIDYKVLIKEENGQLQLYISEELRQFQEQLLQLDNADVVSLLDNMKSIISSKTPKVKFKNLTEMYKHILTEYTEFREFYISIYKCAIARDLSEIRISHLDESNRLQDLVICTDFDNDVFKVHEHSFPERKDVELFQPSNSLKALYETFLGMMEKLQPFFDSMDSLDQSCWILDPEKPTKKDCYRRIGLDINVSVIISFDPWSNSAIPDIKFLGSERLVEDYREKAANNLANWDHNSNIVDELLSLLEMSSFPKGPANEPPQDFLLCNAGECCICFSSRLNEKLPEVVCQNPSCEQVFHTECLYQWLISVKAKRSFNELHGQCPNCEKHISCPL